METPQRVDHERVERLQPPPIDPVVEDRRIPKEIDDSDEPEPAAPRGLEQVMRQMANRIEMPQRERARAVHIEFKG
jgi:hypothetical protein